jgi:hypothetical protein
MRVSMSRVGVPAGEVDGGSSGGRPLAAPAPTTEPVGVLSTDVLSTDVLPAPALALAAGDASGVLALPPPGCVFVFWF